uniref:C-type lectin domain-containing protein n=1 Tax=Echeneis naucrates TaxID=173247 RepID=A0A665W7Q7_ECHNA
MEMQDIGTERGKEKENNEAGEPMSEVETEAGPNHYYRLQSPSEDVYSEACFPGSGLKKLTGKQMGKTDGKAHLYRIGFFVLSIVCIVLLLVIIIQNVKYQTGSTVCEGKKARIASTCSYEECQTKFSAIQPSRECNCADGWLSLDRSCFYLSTFRLDWEQSQRNCTSRGGSLAIISSQKVQVCLNLKYWIGLRNKEATWSWVNDSRLQESYWAEGETSGDCGMLNSGGPADKNWAKRSCRVLTYFICQLSY